MTKPQDRKLREFWIQDHPISISIGEQSISIYQCSNVKPTTMYKDFILAREVNPALDAAYLEMERALEHCVSRRNAKCQEEGCSCVYDIPAQALSALAKARGE